MFLKTEAIVIENRDFREKDKIVGLYTRNYGKIYAIAPSARVSIKRFQGALNVFCLIKAILKIKENANLATLIQTDILNQNKGLLNNLTKISIGNIILELTKELSPEGVSEENIFNFLKNTLFLLANSKKSLNFDLLFSFSFKILKNAGFFPSLQFCSSCGNPLKSGVSFKEGKIFCEKCKGREENFITQGSIKIIERLKNCDIQKEPMVKISSLQLKEIFLFLESIIESVLQKKIVSLEFFKEVSNVKILMRSR